MTRVLVKLSGKAFEDEDAESFADFAKVRSIVAQIGRAMSEINQLEIAIVVGGGNIVRGADLESIDRSQADNMGMLATVINSLALQSIMEEGGIPCRVQSAVEMKKFAEPFVLARARSHMRKGRVVIFAAGTGDPYLTTDTAAAMRANQIGASVLHVAKFGTDGVYDLDPNIHFDAERFDELTFNDAISKNVMDSSAIVMCRDTRLPIFVFDIDSHDGLLFSLTSNDPQGTWIRD